MLIAKLNLGATRYFLVPRSINHRHFTTIHISNYTIYAVHNTSGFNVKCSTEHVQITDF